MNNGVPNLTECRFGESQPSIEVRIVVRLGGLGGHGNGNGDGHSLQEGNVLVPHHDVVRVDRFSSRIS